MQDHYGRNSGHGYQLGVIADGGPEGEDQDWAGDHDGNHNQRPVQPLKRYGPQNLEMTGRHVGDWCPNSLNMLGLINYRFI